MTTDISVYPEKKKPGRKPGWGFVAVHPQRREIEIAIARGEDCNSIAQRFKISYQSVFKHKSLRMPDHLKNHMLCDLLDEERRLMDLQKLNEDNFENKYYFQEQLLLFQQEQASKNGMIKEATAISAELRKWYDYKARLDAEQELKDSGGDIFANPTFIRIRESIYGLLLAWPDALSAVVQLLALEEKSCRQAIDNGISPEIQDQIDNLSVEDLMMLDEINNKLTRGS